MLYKFVKLLSAVACVLPRPAIRLLGKLLGEICWLVVPGKRRKMAVGNIVMGLKVSEEEAVRIAKQSSARFGPMILDVLRLPKYHAGNIGEVMQLENSHYLKEALAHGRGAILATAHTGNWEVLGAALAMAGFPLISVVQKQTNAQMDQFINDTRTKAGMHVVYKTGVRDMVKLLGEGYIVGLLMDQDAHTDGVMVEFMGRMASTPQGAAALARLKDAPIVPVFAVENGDGTHRGIVHPPVWLEKTKDREQDILLTTQQLTKIIEEHIRKYPHEWFWLHNRWKHSPPVQ